MNAVCTAVQSCRNRAINKHNLRSLPALHRYLWCSSGRSVSGTVVRRCASAAVIQRTPEVRSIFRPILTFSTGKEQQLQRCLSSLQHQPLMRCLEGLPVTTLTPIMLFTHIVGPVAPIAACSISSMQYALQQIQLAAAACGGTAVRPCPCRSFLTFADSVSKLRQHALHAC